MSEFELKARIPSPAVLALAEAFASIDGALERYRTGIAGDEAGYYDGYNIEAAEIITRLEARGFTIVEIGDSK